MNNETAADCGAVGAPVEPSVRPCYWEHESGHLQEAWPDMPPDDVMKHKGWSPLYGQAALNAAVAAALDAREFVHAESSRIYARLASAVRAGSDDATLASLLRSEVNARPNV